MRKTYYSVTYFAGGMDKATKYFNNLNEARQFARRTYSDGVQVHNVSRPEKIREIERHIAIREYEEAEMMQAATIYDEGTTI